MKISSVVVLLLLNALHVSALRAAGDDKTIQSKRDLLFFWPWPVPSPVQPTGPIYAAPTPKPTQPIYLTTPPPTVKPTAKPTPLYLQPVSPPPTAYPTPKPTPAPTNPPTPPPTAKPTPSPTATPVCSVSVAVTKCTLGGAAAGVDCSQFASFVTAANCANLNFDFTYTVSNTGSTSALVSSVTGKTGANLVSQVSPNPIAAGGSDQISESFTLDVCNGPTISFPVSVSASTSPYGKPCTAMTSYKLDLPVFTKAPTYAPTYAPTPYPTYAPTNKPTPVYLIPATPPPTMKPTPVPTPPIYLSTPPPTKKSIYGP